MSAVDEADDSYQDTAGEQAACDALSDGDRYRTTHHSARVLVSCRRSGGDAKPRPTTRKTTVGCDGPRRDNQPSASPPAGLTGRPDDTSVQTGAAEQPDRLESTTESGTGRSREVTDRADPGCGQLDGRPLSDRMFDPLYDCLTMKAPVHYITNSVQSDTAPRAAALRSPPSDGQAPRVTAFSVTDILDPAKFGGDRRDPGPVDSTPKCHRELWSPWMQRLELQLRAGAAGINNLSFLRGIGQCIVVVTSRRNG